MVNKINLTYWRFWPDDLTGSDYCGWILIKIRILDNVNLDPLQHEMLNSVHIDKLATFMQIYLLKPPRNFVWAFNIYHFSSICIVVPRNWNEVTSVFINDKGIRLHRQQSQITNSFQIYLFSFTHWQIVTISFKLYNFYIIFITIFTSLWNWVWSFYIVLNIISILLLQLIRNLSFGKKYNALLLHFLSTIFCQVGGLGNIGIGIALMVISRRQSHASNNTRHVHLWQLSVCCTGIDGIELNWTDKQPWGCRSGVHLSKIRIITPIFSFYILKVIGTRTYGQTAMRV